ncbi:MAG: pyruvate kinase [Desulfatibacillaceae bacterium]
MRRTKIVATIGPASETPEMFTRLVRAGINVCRLNFAHGSYDEHARKVSMIRGISEREGKPVAILQDLAGPKIRVGDIPEPGVVLEAGQTFFLKSNETVGTIQGVSTTYPDLPREVERGDPILLADGMLELVVTRTGDNYVQCKVLTGGRLTSHKGINLPTRTLRTSALTDKDRRDLAFGLEHGVDFVGLSFARTANDILEVKELQGDVEVPVIAKIEKHEAVDNIDEILAVADGIMVARGDLGVEIALERVPMVQKMLIAKANRLGKPVITATQMLRSMVDSPRPTRAEATDVANAVLDGTDAVMLSEETAMGEYPVEAVEQMDRIARRAEEAINSEKYLFIQPERSVSDSVAHAACVLAEHLAAGAIVATTDSGTTAMRIARYRPHRPILAFSPNDDVVRLLALFWGVHPVLVATPQDTDELIERAGEWALETGLVNENDIIVITAGHPIGGEGKTNMLRVKRLEPGNPDA